jgi:hypothetical protein
MHIAYYLGRKKENPQASLLDRVTCFFSNSRYSHVELIYDWSDVTKRGRCFSSSPRDGGVRGKTVDFDTGRWEVFEFDTNKTEDDAINWFAPKLGAKYDWFGAIGTIFPVPMKKHQRWFCSEIVLAFLEYEFPWKYSPGEMFDMLRSKSKRVL